MMAILWQIHVCKCIRARSFVQDSRMLSGLYCMLSAPVGIRALAVMKLILTIILTVEFSSVSYLR
ncbi:hypothetical protein K491DRAFT_454794 [Lophiostoma macrostomum CBS 122681]|uniref:Uncharacterized protein n=1 Tax=Lophiostoma macrostomum CBS 122681 TaxID=1314788 RepID=A0A6A6T4N1_9PLEO|nr:hypothetical protein K491DRAFT_454794 [Lophiostoma macrostomum CBS 122681]